MKENMQWVAADDDGGQMHAPSVVDLFEIVHQGLAVRFELCPLYCCRPCVVAALYCCALVLPFPCTSSSVPVLSLCGTGSQQCRYRVATVQVQGDSTSTTLY